MPAEQTPQSPAVVRNGLSVLGVIPPPSETYSVPISPLPPPASPVRSVGIVYPFEPPSTPADWEPHPSIVLVPGGGEGSSRPSAASPSTVSSTPGKRPRVGMKYTQQRLWGASPPRKEASPQRPVATQDKAPAKTTGDVVYETIKHRFETEWQGKFKWLRLIRMPNGEAKLKCDICVQHGDPAAHTSYGIDVTLVSHLVDQTRMRIKNRHLNFEPDHHFGSGEKMTLNDFIQRHQKMDRREVKAEGVDSDGNPVEFSYTLHENPIEGQETDGDVTACFELSLKFVRAVDKELEWRMKDLEELEGCKLFWSASYVPDDAKHVENFKKWLAQLHKLYRKKLQGMLVDLMVCT
ncbi:unnamed protein product [Closterium sp. NIES-65]|nr:unnamed protein product [Closterium sp. NIES-65]